MDIKRIFAFVFALLILFSGCENKNQQSVKAQFVPVTDGYSPDENKNFSALKIPYDYEEGLSPYSTTSKPNRYICGLIYRSMVTLTSSYSFEYDLVSKISSSDNIEWYIYLDDGLSFPNGKEFTAYDLKYSVQQAMAENSYYYSSLDVIDSVNVINATCCKIVLKQADRYFPNLLTFPVISFETSEDPEYFPGRYSLSDDGSALYANSDCAIKEIELAPISDHDLLIYEMKMGVYSCIYCSDPLSLGTSSVGGIGGLQTNKMVYLEFNSGVPFLNRSDFRKAISAAIDYSFISSDIYSNFASVPRSIFNPDFYEMEFISKCNLDLMSANLLLDDIGLTERDSDGFRINSRGNRISFDLLVCSSNKAKVSLAEAIAEMLKEIGIETVVNSVPYSDYITAIGNYNYDMLIGELKVDSDMDISPIIAPNDSRGYALSPKEDMYYSWLEFMAGIISASEMINRYNESVPFVPLCYTKSCVIYSRDLAVSFGGTDFDMFYNILHWNKN